MGITQESYVQFWRNHGSNNRQKSSCTATDLLSHKPIKTSKTYWRSKDELKNYVVMRTPLHGQCGPTNIDLYTSTLYWLWRQLSGPVMSDERFDKWRKRHLIPFYQHDFITYIYIYIYIYIYMEKFWKTKYSKVIIYQKLSWHLVRLTLIVFEIGGRWPDCCCLVGCFLLDLFETTRSILVELPSSFFSIRLVSVHVVHPYISIDTTAAWKNCVLFYRSGLTSIWPIVYR